GARGRRPPRSPPTRCPPRSPPPRCPPAPRRGHGDEQRRDAARRLRRDGRRSRGLRRLAVAPGAQAGPRPRHCRHGRRRGHGRHPAVTDLTPRNLPPAGGAPADPADPAADPADDPAARLLRRRRVRVGAVVAVLVVAAGFVAVQGLRNATLFFRNVDEAIEQRDDLGAKRFRLQGRVVRGSAAADAGVTTFEVVHNCRVASVRHVSDPPELFGSPWIPVVLEGAWTPGAVANLGGADTHYFLSDRMLVKHTNEYASANEGRVSLAPPAGLLDDCGFDDAAS
ncbi:MAG TPA: hypothetical protein DEP66_03255, partial [Acidimicrobiaceae bacterium]|nr:hypothetical protein [Acidimicrobiaceae bacterium]